MPNDEVETESIYEEGSLSADIEQAFDSLTEDTDDGGTEVSSDQEPGWDQNTDTNSDPETTADDTGTVGSENTTGQAQTDSGGIDAPPRSLSPAAREAWKDVPAPVKAEIAKREADYERGIVKYASDAKRAVQMDNVLGQYQQYFAMTGEPVGKTVDSLLRVASNLHMGSQSTKAQLVAGLIHQYGVDVNMLDSLLAGEAPQQRPEEGIRSLIQQELQPFQQYMQQVQYSQQQESQRQYGRIANELQEFAKKNEFYPDVAGTMADFMEIADKQGRTLTLEQAYDMACNMNDQISAIRQARSRAPTRQQQLAASTLRGGSRGGSGVTEPETLSDAVRAAWDSHTG